MSNDKYDKYSTNRAIMHAFNKNLKPRNTTNSVSNNNSKPSTTPSQPQTARPSVTPQKNPTPTQPTTPKYILTNDTLSVDGHKLHRIQALIDIPGLGVEAGDMGGYIENESNLSHSGMCWVFDNAKVYGAAMLKDGATARGESSVCGNQYGVVIMKDGAAVYDKAKIYGNVTVAGCAKIYDNAEVHSELKPSAKSKGGVRVFGSACICDYAIVKDAAKISGNAYIGGDATIRNAVEVDGYSRLTHGMYSDGHITNDGLGKFATHEEI